MWKRGRRPSYKRLPLIERIANKIRIAKKSGCWIWLGAVSKKRCGYPRPVIQLAGRGTPVVTVLRVVLSLKDGVPLDERVGLDACHKPPCTNRLCVNPDHGYWGTKQDNVNDRYRTPRDFGSFLL